jgi:hypothetical protein
MIRHVALVAVAGLLWAAGPAAAQEPKEESAQKPAAAKPATAERILATLRAPVTFEGNLNDIPLFELLHTMSKRYELTFVIMDEPFRAAGEPNIREKRPNLTATQLEGVSLRRFLDLTLGSMNATFLVRKDHLAVVPIAFAAQETKNVGPGREDVTATLKEPLVSAIYKERPLTEAVADLAAEFDLNVVVGPQAGDAKAAFVSARLLNVPADQAVELLAVQADLRVVRKGTAFLVTSKDHANELFAERLERERQMIELEKFRKSPPAVPVPVPPGPAGAPQQTGGAN